MVRKAIELRGGDAEMEFAAAIITSSQSDKTAQRVHLQKALAGAKEGSLLARNIVSHFAQPGQSLADLRAQKISAKK